MGFSDEDKILIKNMHDSKGYRGRAQKNDESFLKRLEQNWTCSVVSTRNKYYIVSMICGLKQSIFDKAKDQWWGRLEACVCAKGNSKYSLWTENVDFVHICFIQCDLTVTSLITKLREQRWPILVHFTM